MPQTTLGRVVILGGGTAGWMTAAAMAHAFKERLASVTLIESDEIGTVGVGEATIPPIVQFNQMLGIDEAEFLRETKATFKLGIEFDGWLRPGQSYIHPFGTYGADLERVRFHQYWLKLKSLGHTESIGEYSLAIMAANNGRFRHPSPDPQSVLSTYKYAYHFDAGLYAAYLRRFSEKRGVERLEGKVLSVALDPNDGFVMALNLDYDRVVSGDFFVDCSGFRGVIIEQALGVGYEDWSNWLPCDRALAMPTRKLGPPIPYTRARAHDAGWQWRIPLQHRTGNGYVFSSAFIDADRAAHILTQSVDSEPLTEPRLLRFTTGRRKTFWHKNCLAVGLASGFLEPLESTSIHLIQSGVMRFLGLLPIDRRDARAPRIYNRLADEEFENIRDFLVLHYALNDRTDSEFWNYCRNYPLPDSVLSNIDLFKDRGRVVRNAELFQEESWVAVLTGQGVESLHYDPMVDVMAESTVAGHLANIRQHMRSSALAMQGHETYLQAFMGRS
jgi:tryptophan halogenase